MSGPILMVIPTLGRPEGLSECLRLLTVNGTGQHDLLTLDGPGGFYEKVNSLPIGMLDQYDILGIMGNDCRMRTPKWDAMVIARMSGKVGILFGRDGIQNERLCTAPFISTKLCLGMGFVYPGKFQHMKGDRGLYSIAKAAKCIWYEPSLHTEHLHPCVGKSPMDAVYQKGMASQRADDIKWGQYLRNGLKADIEKARKVVGHVS